MAKVGSTPPPDDEDIVDGELVGVDPGLANELARAQESDSADRLESADEPGSDEDLDSAADLDSRDDLDDDFDDQLTDAELTDAELTDAELTDADAREGDAALLPANRRVRGRAGVLDKEFTAITKDVTAKDLKTKEVRKRDVKDKAKTDSRSARAGRDGATGPAAWFQSAVRFLREIVAEMRKVIWPSRQELITYTIVVVIFVVILVSIVAGLDIGFAKLTLWVFG